MILSIAAVCLGYVGATYWSSFDSGDAEPEIPVVLFEGAKTDFISVAIFDGEKVKGYASFRVAFSISDAGRAAEVGYLASDVLIRRKLTMADLAAGLPALSKMIEGEIKAHVEGKLPAELVKSVQIADFGFDARV